MSAAQRDYFAACSLGLEPALAMELEKLGAGNVRPARGGVHFEGDLATGYAANLWLRTAVRVQEVLTAGEARTREDLYRLVAELDWSLYMRVDQTLAVDASIRDTFLTDSRFAGQIVKDAVVDQFRKRAGARPDVDRHCPDLPLKLHLRDGRATLYRDLSGTSLHKRGYRPIQVKSPLNEAIAAGMLLLTGWDRQSPLLDPMCGSGTIAIEAALLAGDRAPGMRRLFAFELWPDFDDGLWQQLRGAAEQRAASAPRLPPIEAADRHGGALSIAQRSAVSAGTDSGIRFSRSEVRHLEPAVPPSAVYVNPPYGERIGADEDLTGTWRDLGRFLRDGCGGARAFVLSGNPELTRHLGLRADRRWAVRNGPIDCRILRYQIRGRSEPRPAD